MRAYSLDGTYGIFLMLETQQENVFIFIHRNPPVNISSSLASELSELNDATDIYTH